MFYSTDLLLRKDARFSLIWRLAVTKGHAGGTKKRQILAVNIDSIVAELLRRIPTQPLTADQQTNCFSLRLISQLLYGTCIVLQYQISNLHVDAKHVWDSCRHIRFDEKEKSTKRRKRDEKGDDMDWDQFPLDEPVSKKRKRRSDFDKDELHESQVAMGMDFLDRALMNSRSAYDITNITLPDDTMFIGGGMNDPMFIMPEEDLIPTTDAMMDAFLNGEDTTFTTKEASENRSQEHLRDISSFGNVANKPRVDRAVSEAVERHRASSHVSHMSVERTMQQPLMDDMMMMDDLNLSSSMADIVGDTRTSVPAHFISSGPLAVSSQVNPALEPILPSEASQIVSIGHANSTVGVVHPFDDFFLDGMQSERRIPSARDDEEAKRATAGSEENRRDIMGDHMMADEMENGRSERRREGVREPSRIEETPKVDRRREETDEEEREVVRPIRAPKSTKLDGAFMKESMADWSDTVVGNNARRVKLDDKRKKKATDLFKSVPSIMRKDLAKNCTLNNLFKLLKVDKVKLIDDHDPFDEDERILESWEEMERERRQLERLEEEEEENIENEAKRRREERVAEDMNQSMHLARMDDMTMMDNVTMERVEGEHISVATIEGDWEERIEYMDELMETRKEDRELTEDERRKLIEQRGSEAHDEDDVEEARRRRTTGNFSDGIRMGDQMDLMDNLPPMMMMDESRRSEERMDEREIRDDGPRMEAIEIVERRLETEARVNKDKRKTMAQVENFEAQQIILSACRQSIDGRATLDKCIPPGANKATVARMFYQLLVLTKEKLVVPDQTESYGPIQIGQCKTKDYDPTTPCYAFPIYEEIC